MAISESQLKIWAKPQKTEKAQYTHSVIRKAIRNYNFSRDYNFVDYLQGSYASHTNIYADTDIDIVIQLNSIFHWNGVSLSPRKQKIINERYPAATYSLEDFKSEVIKALKENFEEIEIGNKSVKVLPDRNGSRYKADVVIALQYRHYVREKDKNTKQDNLTALYYYEGIWFRTAKGEEIINYPKLHLINGSEKNKRTNEKFKPIVRIFKNMRNKAIEQGYLLNKTIAPSYFVQCLLYNVPDSIYLESNSLQELVEKILLYLEKKLNSDDWENFYSQNEIVPLFGAGSDKWKIKNARTFIKALLNMWED